MGRASSLANRAGFAARRAAGFEWLNKNNSSFKSEGSQGADARIDEGALLVHRGDRRGNG
jgi:hypothetical protein